MPPDDVNVTLQRDNDQQQPPQDNQQEPPQTQEPVMEPPEPPPGHPRFKEVYGKMKHYERQLADAEERDKELDAKYKTLLEHNEKLSESLDVLLDRMDVQQRPDPVSEPEKYEQWIIQRTKRELEKERKQDVKIPDIQPPPSPQQPLPGVSQEKINRTQFQIAAMEATFDDYADMIALAEKDMGEDSVLRNEIWASQNPPKKAYQYAKQKLERAKQQQQTLNNQTFTEGPSSGQPPPSSNVLSDEMKHTAARLGISEEAYAKQMEYMRKAGIYRG